ncbi:MAG: hypothetical protein M0006_11340 [Magnetospirillum sp.]|nr:hypothetical protein [Magnetospirillum sp.]
MTNDASAPSALPAFAAICTVLALCAGAVPAAAQDLANDSPFPGAPPLQQSALQGLRGGMMVGGIPVEFAVVLNTTIQGADQPPATLATTLAINNSGGIGNVSTATSGGTLTQLPNGALNFMTGAGTGVLQQVLANQINTLIHNSANGAMVAHSTSLNITLPGFLRANQNFNAMVAASRMGLAGSLAGLGH